MSIELQPVTKQNWKALIDLKVRDDQKSFVASNLYSIAEMQFGFEDEGHWDAYAFGAYEGETPVGFLMYCYNFDHSRFQSFVMRLMIDQNFQGKGFGREIMQQAMEIFRAEERIKNAGISYEPDNDPARKLYASFGFVETGEIVDGEMLAIVKLR
jgi:diamine N-acetyltransferase